MTYLRRLPKFEYVGARSVREVSDLLARRPDETRLLAGGTDLILQMRRREVAPRYLVGLKGVSELAFVRQQEDGGMTMGALTTFQDIETSPLIREKYGILSQTASQIGGVEIRGVATIGGNLMGAQPCSDFPAPLITLGAKVKLVGKDGERLVALEDFFPEYGRTVAAPDEILTEILLPATSKLSGGCYLKFHDRHAMDMTITGAAAFVTLNDDRQTCSELKIALSSSAPVPKRVKKAGAFLQGKKLTEDALEETAALACQEAEPRSSWRARREFRLELIRGLTKRAVRQAWEEVMATANGGRK